MLSVMVHAELAPYSLDTVHFTSASHGNIASKSFCGFELVYFQRKINSMSVKRVLLTSVAFAVCAASQAQTIWDESVNGDLSGDRLVPTSLALGLGNNTVIGSMGGSDKEYVHFSLAPGMSLTSIFLTGYTSNDEFSFIGFQAGSTFTEDPLTADPANMLGWALFGGSADIGVDLLARMQAQTGTIGFTAPLTGSDYTFWIQQTGDPTEYSLNFTTVPEPTTIAAIGFGLAVLAKRRRKSSK